MKKHKIAALICAFAAAAALSGCSAEREPDAPENSEVSQASDMSESETYIDEDAYLGFRD